MKPHKDRAWRASRDGPWPVVRTHGRLEEAEREWLHTNGAGAYSMSTLALMHTRREHGLLVAPLDPPLDLHVVLSHAEMTVEAHQRHYRLSTHRFPDVAPTPGYRLLHTFAQDPIPRWVYILGKHKLERIACLARGINALVLGYTWHGRAPARLSLKPLMPLRPANQLAKEHGAMMQRVTLRQGEVEVQPIPKLPPITFAHDGVFMGSPDWWRRFEYVKDRERQLEYQEDMWTPGVFELTLEPGVTSYLVASVGELPHASPQEIVAETTAVLQAGDIPEATSQSFRALSVSAERFVLDACPRSCIVAGYPSLGVRSRDMVIALQGLEIARGNPERAKRVLSTVLSLQRGGLLSDILEQAGSGARSPVADATLWLLETARQLVERVGPGDEFVRARLYPALRRAFVRISGKGRWIWLTDDGLVANHDDTRALTWMDAHIRGHLVTPRQGLAVELQALWTRGSETIARLARAYGDTQTAERALACVERARTTFRERFWCNETDYPFDCISEARDSGDAWVDPSVRPNAVIALAVDPELFLEWQATAILERASRELLTPGGLRTLAPNDDRFIGQFGGSTEEYEAAYHQGTAWPHLLSSYVRAQLHAAPAGGGMKAELRQLVEGALDHSSSLGSVSQLATGDPPHRSRGCPAYAMAVGELLAALMLLEDAD